jgi:type IV pilus assembly protein PilQ
MKQICKNNKKNVNTVLLGALASTLVGNAIAQTQKVEEVKDQSVKTEKSESLNTLKSIVNLNFNKDVKADFNAFVIAEKNQIVFEVIGVDRSFNLPVVENDPLIKNISSQITGNKLKMVVETKKPVKFKVMKLDSRTLLLLEESSVFLNEMTGEKAGLKTSGLSNSWSQVSTKNVEGKQVNVENALTEITKINLKREGSRGTKLSVDISNSVVAPIVTKDGNKLILDFKNISIPNELQRRVNTESLSSVTQSLDVSMQKNNGRIILEQVDGWDYSSYQLEKQFVLEVKPLSKEAEAEKRYIGKKLSISFQDMEVRAILQVIADFTGLNIMSSDQVSGTMTIRLKDVPWDQALDLIMESRGLKSVKDGNVVWIATADEVKKNNAAKLDLRNQNEELGEMKLEFFQVNYYKAEDLKKVLENENKEAGATQGASKRTFLSSKGSVGVDVRNNVLFVQDTEEKLKEVRKLIRKFDVANKQVLVEAKIVIADKNFGRDIGTRFGVRYRKQDGDRTYGVGGNITESGSVATASPDGTPFGYIPGITPLTNLASGGINGVTPGVIGLTILNSLTGNALGLELSALENNNRGKVLSSPRLLTANNKKASIEQGSEIPYATSSDGGTPEVQFKKAVLKLEVTPQIAPNGKVVLDLTIHKDNIGQLVPQAGGGSVPSIETKKIQTLVTVNNGQTVVLGGVYEIENQEDISKIPFFGDIPFIGNLFKHSLKNEAKGELMIFITPYIIEDEDLDDGKTPAAPEINLSKK